MSKEKLFKRSNPLTFHQIISVGFKYELKASTEGHLAS